MSRIFLISPAHCGGLRARLVMSERASFDLPRLSRGPVIDIPALVAFREKLAAAPRKRHTVQLSYLTARGKWYDVSWKGVEERSGDPRQNGSVLAFDVVDGELVLDAHEEPVVGQADRFGRLEPGLERLGIDDFPGLFEDEGPHLGRRKFGRRQGGSA